MTEQRSDSTPSVDHILGQIDAEISYLQSAESAGGWNIWTLSGVLIGVIALLLPYWEQATIEPLRVGLWFVGLSLFTDAVLPWVIPGARPLVRIGTKRVLRRARFFQPRNTVFFAIILRYIGLLIVVYLTSGALGQVEPRIILFLATMIILMRLLIVVAWMLFVNFKGSELLPDDSLTGGGMQIFTTIPSIDIFQALFYTFLPIILSFVYFFTGGWPSFGQKFPSHIVVAFLFVTAVYILLWLLDMTHRPPTKKLLLDVRRKVALGDINSEEAIIIIKEIITGPKGVAYISEFDEMILRKALDQPPK